MEEPKTPARAQVTYKTSAPLKLENGIDVSVVFDNSKNSATKTTYFSHKRGLNAEVKTSRYYSHADDIVATLMEIQKQTDPETSRSAPSVEGKERLRRKAFYNTNSHDAKTRGVLKQIEKWTLYERSLVAQAKVNDILDDEIYRSWLAVRTFEEATAFFVSGPGKTLLKIVERGHFYHVRTTVLAWVFYKLFPSVHVTTPDPSLFIKNFPAAGFMRITESLDDMTQIKLNIVNQGHSDELVYNNFWFFRMFVSRIPEKTFNKIETKALGKRLGMNPASLRQLKLQKVTPLIEIAMGQLSTLTLMKRFAITAEFIDDNAFPLSDIRLQGKIPLKPRKELPLDGLSVEVVRFVYADIVPAVEQRFTVNIMRDIGFLMDAVFENVDEIWLPQLVQSMSVLSGWEKFSEMVSTWLLEHMYYREDVEKYGFVFSSNTNYVVNQKKKFDFDPVKKDPKNKDLVKEELTVNTYYNRDFWSDLSYVRNAEFYAILKQYISTHFERWFKTRMPRPDFNVNVVLQNPPFVYEIDRLTEIVMQDYPDDDQNEEELQESLSAEGSEEEISIGKQTTRQKKLSALLASTKIVYNLVTQTIVIPQKMQKQ